MKGTLKFDKNMRMIGINENGIETYFDAVKDSGGDGSAASPMEVMLQSVAACQAMDIVSILRKKRKDIIDFKIELDAEKAETHPKYFTKIKLLYKLISEKATEKDLLRCIELSQNTYCGALATFKQAETEIEWEYELINP